jgi:hypothetical protein
MTSSSAVLRIIPPTGGASVSRLRVICTPMSAGTAITQYVRMNSEGVVQVVGLTSSTPYYIQVAACGLAGCATFGTVQSVRTAPNVPTNFRATTVSGTAITLAWAAPTPALAYTYRLRQRTVEATATFVISDGRVIVAGSSSTGATRLLLQHCCSHRHALFVAWLFQRLDRRDHILMLRC